jgi:hypothetical protein
VADKFILVFELIPLTETARGKKRKRSPIEQPQAFEASSSSASVTASVPGPPMKKVAREKQYTLTFLKKKVKNIAELAKWAKQRTRYIILTEPDPYRDPEGILLLASASYELAKTRHPDKAPETGKYFYSVRKYLY